MSKLRPLLALSVILACGASADKPKSVATTTTSATTALAPAPAKPVASDDVLADRYLAAKERFAALLPEDKAGPARVLGEVGQGLREVADSAKDVHLRANASLLLGSMYEQSGDLRAAISFYRQASALLPDESGANRVLAIALAADNQFKPALAEMRKVVADDADDLEAWLLTGEIAVKADDRDTATEAYAAYEMRRKGLIDGLTLKSPEGVFTLPPDQRAGCARALVPARDNGTAVALLYSLSIETDPAVRLAVVEAMGAQRLAGYKATLEPLLAKESDQELKETIGWALAEIQRDPLETKPGMAPVDPTKTAVVDGTAPAGNAGDTAATGDPAANPGGTAASGKPAADAKAPDTKGTAKPEKAPVTTPGATAPPAPAK